MLGVVRWYSAKGFGFIDCVPFTDGRALYFHVCDVPNRIVFKSGDGVQFDTVQTPRGLKCVNVRAAAVDTNEATPCTPQTT